MLMTRPKSKPGFNATFGDQMVGQANLFDNLPASPPPAPPTDRTRSMTDQPKASGIKIRR
jgi:hypothetical protein